LSKDLTIKVFLSLREGTSRLSGSVIKSSPSEGRGDDRNNNIIPPSNVPDMLPTMSVQDIWSKEVTITPREVAPQIVVEKTDIERIEEGSDKESEEEEKRAWKRSRVEMEDMRKVVVRDMFRMPSDDDEEDAADTVWSVFLGNIQQILSFLKFLFGNT
jgi:hypothetical protein